MLFYLVHDIKSPIYFHQSSNIFFNETCCYDYFNDAVKCILMPPQDLDKVGWFQSRKINKYFNKKICGLGNWGIDVTNNASSELCHICFEEKRILLNIFSFLFKIVYSEMNEKSLSG
jgi:hypothetical protein